jgi:isopenicillin N synthase-like dioxygenase
MRRIWLLTSAIIVQVVNAGDALEFLCGGFYPSTRHRVVQPPADKHGISRLGVFYFVMANDDVRLVPHEKSPVLQTVGITRLCDPENAPTMEEWRKARITTYGKVALKAGEEAGVEEEIVNGVVVKHYN